MHWAIDSEIHIWILCLIYERKKNGERNWINLNIFSFLVGKKNLKILESLFKNFLSEMS